MSDLIFDGFLASVQNYPERTALRVSDRDISYIELYQNALKYASAIQYALPTRPSKVGIFTSRNISTYTSVLGALFAGATYVPLNCSFPSDRTKSMIENAGIDLIITDEIGCEKLEEVISNLKRCPVVLLPEINRNLELPLSKLTRVFFKDDVDNSQKLAEPIRVNSSEYAYILFTSGSSGEPKAIPIMHANVSHFLKVSSKAYKFRPSDRVSQSFDLTFDLSVFDLFMTWSSGAMLCVVPTSQLFSPIKFIKDNGISIWFSVPSVAKLLECKNSLTEGSLTGLRLSMFCGEALQLKTAQAWQRAAPFSKILNLYGPTELTIACSKYEYRPGVSESEAENGIVPIGKIHDGLSFMILDNEGNEVSSDQIGELVVAGPQTFNDYLKPKDNNHFFYKERSDISANIKYYRTGDLVKLNSNGDLVYFGRNDSQVKISGFRVEICEVEENIRLIHGINEVAVTCKPIEGVTDTDILVAYYTGEETDKKKFVNILQTKLPDYMIPKVYIHLRFLPLNVNGKVDRRQIAESNPVSNSTVNL